jgi:Phage capsid family.
MMQSDPSVEAVIRDDMVRQFAAEIEPGCDPRGGGANEPTGILETSGIDEIYTAASGDAGDGGDLAYTHMVELEKEVAIDNALNGNLFFLTNPKVVAQMRQTPRQASGSEGNFILNDTNEVLGYSVEKTNLVPSDLTTTGGGSALSALIFGKFGDLMIGMLGGLDVLVDRYTGSGTGATRVAMHQDIDVAVCHAESFDVVMDMDA